MALIHARVEDWRPANPRISVGGWLTWTAANAAIETAERIIDEGDFTGLGTPGRIREWLGG